MFRDRKFQLACEDPKQCAKRFGKLAPAVQRRLVQLRGAATLAQLPLGRPHPLSGDRAGQFGITISANYRLVIEPAENPVPLLGDGELDLTRVTVIKALDVEDYHD